MKEITVDDLESLLATGVQLVDVREPDEYESGHVPGAISVPLGEVAERVDECVVAGQVTYMICRSGGRSANACALLADRGYEAVNVAGGTMAWMTSGRGVIEGNSPK